MSNFDEENSSEFCDANVSVLLLLNHSNLPLIQRLVECGNADLVYSLFETTPDGPSEYYSDLEEDATYIKEILRQVVATSSEKEAKDFMKTKDVRSWEFMFSFHVFAGMNYEGFRKKAASLYEETNSVPFVMRRLQEAHEFFLSMGIDSKQITLICRD